MEFFACIFGGVALMICGLILFRFRPPNWENDGELAADPQRAIAWWSGFQRNVRWANNGLLVTIGAAIVTTAFLPHGRWWIFLWSAILVFLMICILFALMDAFSSLAGYRRALPEAARRSLGGEHEQTSL